VSRRKESAFPRHIILLLHGCLRGKLYRQRRRRFRFLYAANNIILCRFIAVIKTNGGARSFYIADIGFSIVGPAGGNLYLYIIIIHIIVLYTRKHVLYDIININVTIIIMLAVVAKDRKRDQRYFGPST